MDAKLAVPASLPVLTAPTPSSNSTAPRLVLWAPTVVDGEELAPQTPLPALTLPAPSATPQPAPWASATGDEKEIEEELAPQTPPVAVKSCAAAVVDKGEGIAVLAALNGLGSGGMFSPVDASPRPHLQCTVHVMGALWPCSPDHQGATGDRRGASRWPCSSATRFSAQRRLQAVGAQKMLSVPCERPSRA
jgi:hypothetical protein